MLQKIIFISFLLCISNNALADESITSGASSIISSIKLYLGIFLAFMLLIIWKMKSCLTKIIMGVISVFIACYCFFKFF